MLTLKCTSALGCQRRRPDYSCRLCYQRFMYRSGRRVRYRDPSHIRKVRSIILKKGVQHSCSQQNRYAWIPQVFSLLVLIGSAGREFNTSLQSIGPPGTVAANRCSFFALQFSVAVGFSVIGADFYVYYRTLFREHSLSVVISVCVVSPVLRAGKMFFIDCVLETGLTNPLRVTKWAFSLCLTPSHV